MARYTLRETSIDWLSFNVISATEDKIKRILRKHFFLLTYVQLNLQTHSIFIPCTTTFFIQNAVKVKRWTLNDTRVSYNTFLDLKIKLFVQYLLVCIFYTDFIRSQQTKDRTLYPCRNSCPSFDDSSTDTFPSESPFLISLNVYVGPLDFLS